MNTEPVVSSRSSPVTVLVAVLVTSALVTAASYLTPARYAATAVGGVFLAATWVLVLRHDDATLVRHGLSLGGLFGAEPVRAGRLLREGMQALGVALFWFALIAVPFVVGYRFYSGAEGPFSWSRAVPDPDLVLGQLLVIALPEEAFFRGFVQSRLSEWLPKRVTILSLPIGPAVVLTSLVFALGHFATIPHPARLAVFFPSLLFGALRDKTGGIGAGLLLHAMSNLLSGAVARGYAGT